MNQQIPFLDELKQDLMDHAPQHPSTRRRPRLKGAWVAAAAFVAVLLVGGLTWILAGGGSKAPVANAPTVLDSFSSGEVVYEFRTYTNTEGPGAPCVGVTYRDESGITVTMACPTEEAEESEYAAQVDASPWNFVVGYGLEPGESIEVEDAVRVVTTEQVNGRRFFLVQLDQPPDGSFQVPITRPDGTTRFITPVPPDIDPTASPLALAVEHVWPESGIAGDPEDVAREFAETLGWTEANVSIDPNPNTDGQVWVFIQQPGREELPVLTTAISDGLRVLNQIGSSAISVGTNGQETADSQWVGFRPIAEATMADVHVRLIEPDRVDVIQVPTNEPGAGRVTVEDIAQIASVLVVYRNETGDVVTASGAHFAPFEETEPRTPEEILADGVVTESEYRQAATAVLTCLNETGIRAEVELDANGASFTTPGDADEAFGQCHQQHLGGGVDLAWADQNPSSAEREVAFYNDVVSCVEAQTGKDYGDVEAGADTKATDAAIDDAPDLYGTCFDQIIGRYPDY